VREFCEIAFARAGLDWSRHVVIDPELMRPAEVDQLIGDPSKANAALGWKPTTTFAQLVELMVDSDVALLSDRSRRR
jgi:GDPmannose 4,6-dehydratase